jgi:hypothetical protein
MWRWGVGLTMAACEIVRLMIASSQRQASSLLTLGAFAGLGLAAAALALLSAKRFETGQTARRVWMLMALMPLVDVITLVAYSLPRMLGDQSLAHLLVGGSTALTSLSRILAAAAFFMMLRLYRQSGLKLTLRAIDYAAMAVIVALGVISVALSGRVAGLIGGADEGLQSLVLMTGVPLLVALIPCAVFGVMIWRWADEMGGGLVAKAWRSVLLYSVLWIVRLAYTGALVYLIDDNAAMRSFGVPLLMINWLLIVSEYLIFLGASYQYQACTGSIEIDGEMSIMPS